MDPDPPIVEPARMAYAPPLFASSTEEPRRRSGLGLWFTAAASLVLGIVIGFASGFRAAQNASAAPATVEGPAPTTGSAAPGQPFSESPVSDPVRLEPEEIVPAPSAATSPAPSVPPAPEPTAVNPPQPAAGTPRPAPAPRQAAAPARVVEERQRVPSGPGSLQVVSRPAGAEVIVDGKSVGRTPLSIEVSPGSHTVRLALPGFNAWQTTVDIQPGSPTRVSGSLEQ
jgi:hypothetical protein